MAYSTPTLKQFFDSLSEDKRKVFASRIESTGVIAMNFKEKKNALSRVFVDGMSNALNEIERNKNLSCVIICSTIPNVFCAGADLRERAEYTDSEVPAVIGGLRSLFQRVYNLPMPTIAAIDGAALGGGLELALSCDVRFAGCLPRVQIGLIETHWALLPGAGGSQRLPRTIGINKAKELMYAARRLTPRQAEAYGIVSSAIDPANLSREWMDQPGLYGSLQYVQELSSKGPIALRELKRAVNEGMAAGPIEAGLEVEGECYKRLIPTKDRKEGMAAFIEKRLPRYKGE